MNDLCLNLIDFFASVFYRLLALEDRFHDLEGHQTRTARSEQQKYTEYIVSERNDFNLIFNGFL